MLNEHTIVVLHNIVSPYKTLLFNQLYKICTGLKVLYIAETETSREWNIDKNEIKFPFEIMFKGVSDDLGFLKPLIKTWERLNSLNPEAIIISGYAHVVFWTGFFWAKVNRKKIILWSSSNKDDKDRLFLKEKLKSFLIKGCDAANVYGQRSKGYLVNLGMKDNKVFIKGNVTDNSFYYSETMKARTNRVALCREFGIPSHNFIYIGRFSQEKNLFFLLNAYMKLEVENWGLVLVGSGPQFEEIKAFVKGNFIKNVLMPGFMQKNEISQFLAISDVLILPSISEPWGLVVNEAMAAGLPVFVSRKCGCYPDLIKEGVNGFSFDPFDKDGLFNLMKEVIRGNLDLTKMGKASLEIIEDYRPEKAAKVIVDTVNFVLEKK